MKKILIVAPTWVGDSLFMLPSLAALRRRWPQAEITLLAKPGIVALHDAVALFDGRIARVEGGYGRRMRQYRSLRKEGFDLALVYPDSFSSALGAFLSGARLRVGRRGQWRGRLLNRPLPQADRKRHISDEYMDLARAVGAEGLPEDFAWTLAPSKDGIAEAQEWFRAAGDDEAVSWVGLCPTTAFGPSKAWPLRHWASLIDLLKRAGHQPVVLAAPHEKASVEPLAKDAGVPMWLPTLPGLSAAMTRFRAVIANDSGPLHLASAVGAACVGIYGPVDPLWSAPLSKRSAVLYRKEACSPCHQKECPLKHHDCLEKIEPAQVMGVLDPLLHSTTD